MSTRIPKKKYTCLLYGEGKRDRNFLDALRGLEKFRFYTKKWSNFRTDNHHGSSAKDILISCKKSIRAEDLVLCFIDLDDLKNDYPSSWKEEKKKLELKYKKDNIIIIWQVDNAEDEYERVIPEIKNRSKNRKNKIAIEKIKEFINSKFWKRILKPIKEKEEYLENKNKNN